MLVVGAGLSGLRAAQRVVAAGHSALVFKARDRVGGRTLNHPLGGGKVVEVGGQWVGPTQDHVLKLARSLGVGTFKTYNKGNYLFYEQGKLTPYSAGGASGAIPPDINADLQVLKVLQQLDAMALTVPLNEPWKAAQSWDWDSVTFESYKRQHTLDSAASGIESVFACEPRDISLLHVVFYVHSAGNETTHGTFERLINTAGGRRTAASWAARSRSRCAWPSGWAGACGSRSRCGGSRSPEVGWRCTPITSLPRARR